MSGAPGIRIGNIFIMAGVPHITAGMLDALTGTLEGGRPVVSATIGCWVAESEVADLLRDGREGARRASRSAAIRSSAKAASGANFVVRSPDQAAGGRVRGGADCAVARLRAMMWSRAASSARRGKAASSVGA